MIVQSALMVAAAIVCFASALGWMADGNYASASAFLGFGAGYVGLAYVFGGM